MRTFSFEIMLSYRRRLLMFSASNVCLGISLYCKGVIAKVLENKRMETVIPGNFVRRKTSQCQRRSVFSILYYCLSHCLYYSSMKLPPILGHKSPLLDTNNYSPFDGFYIALTTKYLSKDV